MAILLIDQFTRDVISGWERLGAVPDDLATRQWAAAKTAELVEQVDQANRYLVDTLMKLDAPGLEAGVP